MSVAKPQSANLIEVLSAGYSALHRRPVSIGIRVGLSAYLWLGAPLLLTPLAEGLRPELSAAAAALGGDQGLVQAALAADMRVAAAWLNFVPVLAPPATARAAGLSLSHPAAALGAALLINLVALLASGLFLSLLGTAVRGQRAGVAALLRQTVRVAADIWRALLALLGVGLILALPFLAISAILVVSLPGSLLPVLLAWYVVLFWVYVYTGFAPEAMVISDAGPLRAIYHSVGLVRRNMAATLALLLLSLLISSGLGVIWRQLAATPAGLGLAILGSAYVGSGLSAARLEFYRSRLARSSAPSLR